MCVCAGSSVLSLRVDVLTMDVCIQDRKEAVTLKAFIQSELQSFITDAWQETYAFLQNMRRGRGETEQRRKDVQKPVKPGTSDEGQKKF